MAKIKTKRKGPDWEAIWVDYRADVLSIQELSRRHNVDPSYVCRKAKGLNVKRDLGKRVRQALETKLVHVSVHNGDVTDDDIIDCESDKLVAIVSLQRKDICDLRELETSLIAELKNSPTKLYITQYQGQIISQAVGLTAAERSQAANNLANVQHKRIQLERQAYNLKDGGEIKSTSLSEILDSIDGTSKGLPNG